MVRHGAVLIRDALDAEVHDQLRRDCYHRDRTRFQHIIPRSVCRQQLKETLGPQVQAQFIQGLAGNVRPRQVADLETGTFRKATAADPVAAGQQLAADVQQALASPGTKLQLELAAVTGFAMAPKDQQAIKPLEHWRQLAQSDDELQHNVGVYWANRLESGLPPVQVVPWAVGLMRLAPGHCIAWLSGEALAEWSALLRQCLEDENLVVWSYCQDGRGYMPTDEIIPQGGYEIIPANTYTTTGPGPFAAGISQAGQKALKDLARRL